MPANWEPRQSKFDEIYAAQGEGVKAPRLFQSAYHGAVIATGYAGILLTRALRQYGTEAPVSYPDTAYHLPVITALSGEPVTRLGELVPILNGIRSQLSERPGFAQARLCGEATLYAAEMVEAIRALDGAGAQAPGGTGFLPDPQVRRYGVKLVDWTIPGQAIIMGRAQTSEQAARVVAELMSKGMMIFLCGEVIEQLWEEGVKLGPAYICFPLGDFTQVIHAVSYALRAGSMFGNIPPGRRHDQRAYQQRRVRAFVLHLGEMDEVDISVHFGAIFLGFPVITDQKLPEEIPDWYLSHPEYSTLVKFAMETRGIKVTSVTPPIPLNYGPAFEGEIIRRPEVAAEFGGMRSPALELVRMREAMEVEDERVTVVGPDLDQLPEGGALPLAIVVDIYGRKLQEDFEGVLERRLHNFVNYAEGLWHVAQRDMVWIRVAKAATKKGFKLGHLGDILVTKYKAEFPAIVDRVQVSIITEERLVLEKLQEARAIYQSRDARLQGLTDAAVDEFYSCTLCQSFAPNHVCVVTPERVGLCGAVSWLDGKASYEINPTGPNRPIVKGECTDPERGSWENVDAFVYQSSHGTVEGIGLYSLMDRPMTSCGCFEAIVAVFPEANGVVITTRESSRLMTPVGMTFSTLAGLVGGGSQTPGFMGIGRSYITSPSFMRADGGLSRIVWMPRELKEFLQAEIVQRSVQAGLGEDFIHRIADESVGCTAQEVVAFLEVQGHPALTMAPIM
ncbi:MAG TPA: CO dehydrogenase/CO-methylating acetyl-CoA synthase complex subunit beta [Clostridiales bacterium UBA8153]|nr:CO dehydrogenase/CO-methylating acetyl-CoA synthase complex subunit beta [Clostridiales bacterium UBA8153]